MLNLAISKRACGAMALLLAVGACADQGADDGIDATDLVATGAGLVERGWERAPVAATVGAVDGNRDRALGADVLAARAAADPAWRSRDGQRYDVMFVAEDGATYGRVGASPTQPLPTAANGFGADDAGKPHVREDLFSILGGTLASDRRLRIYGVASLEAYPYRTIGALSGNGNTQSGGCTGTVVGPRHVLTAAHCVMGDDGVVTTTGFFNPGQTNTTVTNGGNSRRWSGVSLRDWRVHTKYDYALLYLENRADNANLGWMGMSWYSTSGYVGKTAYNRGYPCGPNRDCGETTHQQCLASPRADKRCDGWMYGQTNPLLPGAATSDERLLYDIDTSDGHSGSAVYTYDDGVPTVLAVHHGPSGGYNTGARLRTSMWNDLCTWIGDVPSTFGTHALCN